QEGRNRRCHREQVGNGSGQVCNTCCGKTRRPGRPAAHAAEAPKPEKQASSIPEDARPVTVVEKSQEDESSAWWLNVALVIVIAAIAVLLYFMTQFGDLKGMNIDRMWSYFAPSPAQVSAPAPLPAEAPVTEVVEVVIKKEVAVTLPATPVSEPPPSVGLQPLPDEQQQLLWDALMLPPEASGTP
ncbi:hypothetical protein, partial [Thiolapillus sp.]